MARSWNQDRIADVPSSAGHRLVRRDGRCAAAWFDRSSQVAVAERATRYSNSAAGSHEPAQDLGRVVIEPEVAKHDLGLCVSSDWGITRSDVERPAREDHQVGRGQPGFCVLGKAKRAARVDADAFSNRALASDLHVAVDDDQRVPAGYRPGDPGACIVPVAGLTIGLTPRCHREPRLKNRVRDCLVMSLDYRTRRATVMTASIASVVAAVLAASMLGSENRTAHEQPATHEEDTDDSNYPCPIISI